MRRLYRAIAAALFELGHRALHELLHIIHLFKDERDIHPRFSREALAAAVDTMLTDQRERVGQQVERHGEPQMLITILQDRTGRVRHPVPALGATGALSKLRLAS